MNKIVPDPPCLPSDRECFDRAASHYLQPASPPSFTAHQDLSFEDALAQICDLLRCAAATAFKAAEKLQGASRDLAFSVVHMVDMARAMVDHSLDGDEV